MQLDRFLPAIAALIVIFLLPRVAQGARGLAVVALAGLSAAGLGYLWLRLSAEAGINPVYLLAGAASALALFLGVLIRGTVLIGKARGWPVVADLVLTGGGAAFLALNFLRVFRTF